MSVYRTAAVALNEADVRARLARCRARIRSRHAARRASRTCPASARRP